MKKVLMGIFAMLMAFTLNAQTTDTISYVSTDLSYEARGGKTTYKLNGEEVTKKEFQKARDQLAERKKCNPCYLKYYDKDSIFHSEGLYFYDCPDSKEDEPQTVTLPGSTYSSYTSKYCRHGKWIFYKPNGDVRKVKYYFYNKKMSKRKFLRQKEESK